MITHFNEKIYYEIPVTYIHSGFAHTLTWQLHGYFNDASQMETDAQVSRISAWCIVHYNTHIDFHRLKQGIVHSTAVRTRLTVGNGNQHLKEVE